MDKHFAGFDGFLWWMGTVENRQDPLGLGRVKVRIFGVHTDSLTDIPTDHLPWASVIHAGNDRNFSTPREADLVFGFFADGRSGQNPIVVGVVPGYFTQPADQGSGFHDLRTLPQLKTSPRKIVKRTYKTDGSGISITEIDQGSNTALAGLRHPTAEEKDLESISGVVRGQNLANTVIQARKTSLDKGVVTAGGKKWSEPYPAYNPLYPYNNATESESGHVFELDDTPGNERVHIAHRTGSFVEWYPSGTKVEKVTKSNYQIVMGDDHIHIMGKCQITVQGDAAIRVVGDCALQVENNLGINVATDLDFSVGGEINFKSVAGVNFDVGGDYTVVSKTTHLSSSGDTNITGGGNINEQAGGNLNLKGSTVAAGGGGDFEVNAGLVRIDGGVVIIGHGSSPPGGAASGSAAGIPAAVSAGSPNEATIPNEVAPTPLTSSLITFDPETGLAFKYKQFLTQDANTGQLTEPTHTDSTTAAASASPCMFDTTSKMFATSDAWAISQNGLAFIQAREGFGECISPDLCKPYPDPSPESLAIGYGTHGPVIGATITPDLRWTRAQAQANLELAISSHFLPTLQAAVDVDLTQSMVDACISLMFNIGESSFSSSTLVKRLNAQDWCGAADQFLVWCKTNQGTVTDAGLLGRRKLERTLFLK